MPPSREELQAGLCATPHADGYPSLARVRRSPVWHTPAMRLAGHVIVEQLVECGADLAFCVPGESYLPVLDGLYAHRDRVRLITARQETGAAMMAAAYGKLTGRPGICLVTRGPGATNASGGVHVARQDAAPMVLLVGQVPTGNRDRVAFQEVDIRAMFAPLAKAVFRVDDPDRAAEFVARAMVTAVSGEPGPVVLELPEDVLSAPTEAAVVPAVPPVVPAPAAADVDAFTGAVLGAERPLLVVGGGARYSGAGPALLRLAETHGVPVVETPAGRTVVAHDHRLHAGPLGIIGSSSANTLAAEADVVVAVGTRLQDFTTASWTVFSPSVRVVTVNAARFDAVKHGAHAVVGDARAVVAELGEALTGWAVDVSWSARASAERALWDAHVDGLRKGVAPDGSLTYAQVVGVVNDLSGPDDYVLGSSGGFPGEMHGGWRTGSTPDVGPTSGASMDLEYGFSCMGYEVAGPWGAAMARATTHPGGVVTALLGDGSYLMLNSELYSAALSGHPFVAVVCDNGGYAVIHRLQTGQGADGFNNLLDDCAGPGADAGLRVDFAAHAAALGAYVEAVAPDGSADDLAAAYARARAAAVAERRPAVLVCRTHPSSWTEAGAWWEVGVPGALSGRASYDEAKARQLRWLT